MTTVTIVLVAVLVVGLAIGAYAMFAPRRAVSHPQPVARERVSVTTDWTSGAGDEFSGMTEAARCDLVFAVAALDDERSSRLLEHALRDPAEAVSIAAAHALASTGRRTIVESYLEANPGERAERIANTLALLD